MFLNCKPDWSLSLFSHWVQSNSFQPHGPQHSGLRCPSPSPGVCSNSHPLSRWCHPTISSSVVPFSCCSQSFPASGSDHVFTQFKAYMKFVVWKVLPHLTPLIFSSFSPDPIPVLTLTLSFFPFLNRLYNLHVLKTFQRLLTLQGHFDAYPQPILPSSPGGCRFSLEVGGKHITAHEQIWLATWYVAHELSMVFTFIDCWKKKIRTLQRGGWAYPTETSRLW